MLISLIAALTATGLFFVRSFENLELLFIDRAYKRAPARLSAVPVVFVEIDQQSLYQIGEWPWQRDVHAQLIADLATYGARSIAFDVFFATEITEDAFKEGFFLAQSCLTAENVYFSLNFTIFDDNYTPADPVQITPVMESFACPVTLPDWLAPYRSEPLHIVEPLYASLKGAGHIAVLEDQDGKIRRVPLWLESGDRYFPQLALRIFMDAYGITDIDFPERNLMRLTGNDGSRYGVPIDNRGQLFINWPGDFYDTFYHCSYFDILNSFEQFAAGETPLISISAPDGQHTVDASDFFKDKICLVGFTTAGLVDQKPVPVANRYPLVGIHATIIDTIASQSFFRFIPWWIHAATAFLTALAAAIIVLRTSLVWSILFTFGISAGLFFFSAYLFYSRTLWLQSSYCIFAVAISFIMSIIYYMVGEKKKKSEIERIFKRYVTADVVEAILRSPESMELGGKRRSASIFFCDIRGFTPLTEQLAPEDVITLLNTCFSMVVKIIFHHHGTVDKFIGDCVMAYWGAPTPLEDHAYCAVKAAIDIQKKLAEFNAERAALNLPRVEMGIGIASGDVIAGNVGLADGAFQRTEYTVIGDYVNLASRLSDIAPGTEIFISEETCRRLNGRIPLDPQNTVRIKGKSTPVPVYKLVKAENISQ